MKYGIDNGLLQVLLEERRDLVERDLLHVVVEVRMARAGDDHEFFVRALELLEGTLAEVARMGFLAVNDEHWAFDFTRVGKQRHVHEGERTRRVPTLVGVQGTRMIAALRKLLRIESRCLFLDAAERAAHRAMAARLPILTFFGS